MRRTEWRASASHPNERPLAGAARPPDNLVLLVLYPQERRQDTACVGRRGLRAEAALLVGDRHDVARIRARREHHVPGLIRPPEALLRRAGLAADLDRETPEDVDRSAARLVGRGEQAVHDGRAVRVRDADPA